MWREWSNQMTPPPSVCETDQINRTHPTHTKIRYRSPLYPSDGILFSQIVPTHMCSTITSTTRGQVVPTAPGTVRTEQCWRTWLIYFISIGKVENWSCIISFCYHMDYGKRWPNGLTFRIRKIVPGRLVLSELNNAEELDWYISYRLKKLRIDRVSFLLAITWTAKKGWPNGLILRIRKIVSGTERT